MLNNLFILLDNAEDNNSFDSKEKTLRSDLINITTSSNIVSDRNYLPECLCHLLKHYTPQSALGR